MQTLQKEGAVVQLVCTKIVPNYYLPFSSNGSSSTAGTGFFFEKNSNRILTCAHVIQDAVAISVHIPIHGKKTFSARVLSVCPSFDIAIVEVLDAPPIQRPLVLDSRGMEDSRAGDEVTVIGFPLGQSNLKLTQGVLSGHQRYYQMDSPINGGNSGGPLLRRNKVIGIVNAGFDGAQDVGYAIPIERYLNIASSMLKNVIVRIPLFWGFFHQSIPVMEGESKKGVMITEVVPHSIATEFSTLSLRKGDILTRIAGYEVWEKGGVSKMWMNDNMDLTDLLYSLAPGSSIPFEILRDDMIMKGQFCIEEKEQPVRMLFLPVEKLDYMVFAGMVFLPLTLNLLMHIEYSIQIHDGLDDLSPSYDQKNKIDNGTFLQFMEAVSPKNRHKPRVVIFNVMQGSAVAAGDFFKTGELLDRCNGKKITTMNSLHGALQKPDLKGMYTFQSNMSKTYTISVEAVKEEHERLRSQYHIIPTS